jgi:hypothetical protein
MSPRIRLGRAEAIIPPVAEWVVEMEAGGNVNRGVFEERFASKVRMIVMVMVMIRTRHLESRLLE